MTASLMANRFYFDYACLRKRFFDPPDVQSVSLYRQEAHRKKWWSP